ncbi:SRPBCC family protein [Paucibacter sp. XJ19-41]|uniref:SRPBCC family protein n=1 Tax=Paucibacter sp. XJ19-41 TaxID=2927824 RepID=UPI00234AD79D|nr:SRPBCC family protein [Paucibacter sp. XJ19-41]MDC6171124.1 SRPBCC family protein [Paucibacter sp. XJ19-41]
MIKTIALVIVAALALLLIYAATRPDSFRVERSTRIQAPPEKIYALIHDLKGFNRWNPYEKKDPAIKGQYSAVTAGAGARYGWESDKVGVGSMEITEVAAPSRVAMKLDFVKPFEAHNQVEFRLRPEGGATQVSWAMQGPSPFVSKLIGVFISMDRMIGQDFEDGLANLKSLVEQH